MNAREIRIGIIGGGATGAMAACHLLEFNKSHPEFRLAIDIYDPADELGGGRAYRANDERLLLNVPAQKMSCASDRPNEFLEFVQKAHPDAITSRHFPFLPRAYFREYLQNCLSRSSRNSPGVLIHQRSEVKKLEMGFRNWVIHDARGQREYDYVFLAQGYREDFNAKSILKAGAPDSARILSCHQIEKIQNIGKTERVLIVGAGLSAIDTWRLLRDTHQGPIYMLSRRRLLPLPHAPAGNSKTKFPDWTSLSPRQIVAVARLYHRSGLAGWNEIADSIRLRATRVWGTWTRFEKRQFLRHVKPYWEVIRHRLPASIHRELMEDLQSGKVRILGGRISKTRIEDGAALVEWSPARTRTAETLQIDRIVLATGSHIKDTLGDTDWNRIGIDQSEYGLGLMNRAAPYLWILGPQAKSLYWEITAAPEIRYQVESCVQELLWHIQRAREPLWLAQLKVHPHDTEETFLLHFRKAVGFSRTLAKLALWSLIHALVPYKFADNTSDALRDFAKFLSKRREKRLDPSRLRTPNSEFV